MTTVEILIRARNLIADPLNWTQKISARNASDEPSQVSNPDAIKWCAWGALCRVSGSWYQEWDEAVRLFQKVTRARIADFNDSHSHAEVVAAFDRAIAVAESKV